MNDKSGFTIIELSIIIIIISIILGFFININFTRSNYGIKKLIFELENYTTAITNFKRKYGYLPGDLKKTQIFNLSETNTDGNQNGLIEDLNQQKGIYDRNIKIDGEILNFWLNLYKSEYLVNEKNFFPYDDFLETGILVFSDGNNNYYHLGISGINKLKEIQTINNLKPYDAYLIDKKIDDGLPLSGYITVYDGNKLNKANIKKINNKCSNKYEYLTTYKSKLCQLVFQIDI